MDNKNLPVTNIRNLPAVTRPGFAFCLITASILGVVLTSYDFVFIMIGGLGALLFAAGNLINKSLSESQEGFSHPDPLTLSIKQLQHEAAQTKYFTKTGDLGQSIHQQVLTLEERWKFIKSALDKKFSPTELTYSRYLSAVSETVHLMLQNVDLLTLNLKSMELMKTENEGYQTGKKLCLELIAMNETALVQLAELSSKLSLINAGGSTDSSLESSLDELKRLTEQAKKYTK